MMTQEDEGVIIIKIGGSSITNKATEETLNQDAIDWFAKLISASVHTSFLFSEKEEKDRDDDTTTTPEAEARKKPKFVVVHGAGSFGHHSAKRYGLQCGKAALLTGNGGELSPATDEKCSISSLLQRRKRYQMEALSKTRHSVQKLNAAMVGSLLDHGVNACGISPGVSIPGMRAYGSCCSTNNSNNNQGSSDAAMDLLCESINQSLHAGLLPVIHGDACLLDDNLAGILGGDTLVEGLVGSEKMKDSVHKVIFITDVAGVFSSDPKTNHDARLIRSLKVDVTTGEVAIDDNDNGNVAEMDVSGSSHAHDVTGGLKAKLGAAVTAVQCGKDVIIVKCCSTSAEKFVQGDCCSAEEGTLITKKL
jgi:isopentenyl phosphate kinase